MRWLAGLILVIAAHVYAGPRYAITDLGTLGGSDSRGGSLNEAGFVAGTSLLPGDQVRHAFLWSESGGMVDLGALVNPAFNSYSARINEQNQVVGFSYTSTATDLRAFLYHEGVLTNLGALPPNPHFGQNTSFAYGINDGGAIVGTSNNHAFVWTRSTGMIDIGTLGGTALNIGSAATAINNKGQATGSSWTGATTGQNHAFLWSQADGFRDLGTLGGFYSDGADLNEAGSVVGSSLLADDSRFRAFLWTSADGMVELGTLGGQHSFASSINEHGTVVGASYVLGDAHTHAFLWTRAGGLLDLNLLIPDDAQWELLSASDISDRGWITGTGRFRGEFRAYLLRPVVPAPGVPSLLAVGALLAVCVLRLDARRRASPRPACMPVDDKTQSGRTKV